MSHGTENRTLYIAHILHIKLKFQIDLLIKRDELNPLVLILNYSSSASAVSLARLLMCNA